MGANCSRSSSNDVLDTSDPASLYLQRSTRRNNSSSENATTSSSAEQASLESQRRPTAHDHLFPLGSGSGSDVDHRRSRRLNSTDPMVSLFLNGSSGGGSRGRRGRRGILSGGGDNDTDGLFSSSRSFFGGGAGGTGGTGLDEGLGGSLFGSGLHHHSRGTGASSFHNSRWGGGGGGLSPLLHHDSSRSSSIGDTTSGLSTSPFAGIGSGGSGLGSASSALVSSSRSGDRGGGMLGRRRGVSEEQRRNRELEEIERLQQDLAVMEAFFQTLLGRWAAMADGNGGSPGGGIGGLGNGGGNNGGSPPPASESAVQKLPTVVATAEDLVEESNRECCICFVDIHLGDEVLRLPCGHLYHGNCISEWLLKHCTCPVCRYELPTDDVDYEAGRIERMRDRKPRYRRYELDRMSVQELRELASDDQTSTSNGEIPTDKKDLVEHVIASGRFDVMDNPDLVEYTLSDLQNMCVNDLRSTMTNAGVFFNPAHKLEKEDMVQLFLDSGRLMILPEKQKTTTTMTSLKCSCSSDTSSSSSCDKKMAASTASTLEEVDKKEDTVET